MTVDFPVDTYSTMLPVLFEAPPANPSPTGLFSAVNWQPVDTTADARHLTGVEVRGTSYGGEGAFGVWDKDWCEVPALNTTPRKDGDRPAILDAFDAMTVWAYDECDLRPDTRREVQARAAQILRMEEQTGIETEFATRLLADAADLGTMQTAADAALAIGYLEGALAIAGTVGVIHVGAQWAALLAQAQVLVRAGTRYTTPLGHTLVFGGGYVEALDDVLVATSTLYGWRNEPTVRTTIDERHNTFKAVAERTVTIGYEAALAAVQIT